MKIFGHRALTVMVGSLIMAAQAASQGVTVPPGSFGMGATIPIQWNSSFTVSSTVNILLAGYGGSPAPLATSVSNSGYATLKFPVPPTLPCEPNRLYHVMVTPATGAGSAGVWSAQFKLICWGGSLTVVKTIVNQSGRPVPNGAFPVDVVCGPGGPSATLALGSANNFRDSVLYIPPGRTCTINEPAPKAPAGCRWVTTYPQGKGVDISEVPRRLDVRNQLNCQAVGNTGVRSRPFLPEVRPATP